MSNVQVFTNPIFGTVRTVTINNQIFFVGKDVANILGYVNTKQAIIQHVDEEDKLGYQIKTSGQNREMVVINESGLYSLILSSKLPAAKDFKRWITSEVIPAIRKYGAYFAPATFDAILKNPDYLGKIFANWKADHDKLIAAQEQIALNEPKVKFADAVEGSHTSILIGDFAKILAQNGFNIGQKRLFKYLRENGYLIKGKRDDYNMPTQKSIEKGLFEIKENVINYPDGVCKLTRTPKITGKGQMYFFSEFNKLF